MAKLRRGLADDDRDERRLAGAVATDETDLFAFAHDERRIGDQRPIANFDGE